jgi:hypothetical protein
MDGRVHHDLMRHAVATGVPTLGAYAWMFAASGPIEAGAVAFASLIGTQLAQSLEVGQAQGLRSRHVVATVAGTLAALGLGFGVTPIRELFGLVLPSALGWGTVAASSVAAAAISRGLVVARDSNWQELFTKWLEEARRLELPAAKALPPSRAVIEPA